MTTVVLLALATVLRFRVAGKIRTSWLELDFGLTVGPHPAIVVATILVWLIPLV